MLFSSETRPTRVVPDQRPLNGCCCCCSELALDIFICFWYQRANIKGEMSLPQTLEVDKKRMRTLDKFPNCGHCFEFSSVL